MAYQSWWADPLNQNDRSIARREWDFQALETTARYARVLDIVTALRPKACWGDTLELGCAEGFFTQALAGRCNSVMACDISRMARRRAAQRCAALGNVSVGPCDVERLEIQGAFDLIFAMGVLEFIRGLRRFARTELLLSEISKPRGLLILNACRLPKNVRGQVWTKWLGCDGDQMVEFLSNQAHWQLLHHEFYPKPDAESLYSVEQVIAVFEKLA